MAIKGQKQKIRTEKEKYEIIKPILENRASQSQVSKENHTIGHFIYMYLIMKSLDMMLENRCMVMVF